MRTSFRSVGPFLTSLVVASTLLACGGETASLGSQGSEQGEGGASGKGGSTAAGAAGTTANTGGSGTAGKAGSSSVNCATIVPTCDGGEYLTTDPATGCLVCLACPDGECNECPALTPPNPEFCKNGKIVPQKSPEGCDLAPKCVCDATEPNPGCPPGTKLVPDLNGGCTTTCAPASCPDLPPPSPELCPNGLFDLTYGPDGCVSGFVCATASCEEINPPGPAQCPGGGFSPKYGANGCLESYTCLSCPVLGDPSFCADGTIAVGVKEGKCDYGKITCLPCETAEPPVENFCNDGAKVVKQDGKCLGGAQCSCPDYGACPPSSVSLPVPGSFCGRFVCNKVECAPPPAPTEACAGNFEWEIDANGCATKAVCKPSGGQHFVRLGHDTQAQLALQDICVAYALKADGQPLFETTGLYAANGLDKKNYEGFANLTRYLPLPKKPLYFAIAQGESCGPSTGSWQAAGTSTHHTLLSVSYSGEGFALLALDDSGPVSSSAEVDPALRFVNASGNLVAYDVTAKLDATATELFSGIELAQPFGYRTLKQQQFAGFDVDGSSAGFGKQSYDLLSEFDGLSLRRTTVFLLGGDALICQDGSPNQSFFGGEPTNLAWSDCVRASPK